LRIGTNDIIRDRPLEEVTRDISRVADMALEVALHTGIRIIKNRFGEPYTNSGHPAKCVILAFGKHGGKELNYSSDIDLMFLFDEDGSTRGKRLNSITNNEFFARVVSEVVRLLSQHTDQGQAYRVDLRLRPEGKRGPLARSLSSTLAYYDTLGRTWERQALIKLRPCAGDVRLGEQFLKAIEPFVYRKYLTFSEINGIKALKRRIEQQAHRDGTGETEVKTGIGGIRDVEFTIQFLQLLNGGDLPEVRQRNTLKAMQALAHAGCLSDQEYGILQDTYRFLRRVEHRLQLMCDLQTHRLPDSREELRKLAQRMGFGDKPVQGVAKASGSGNGAGDDDGQSQSANGLETFLAVYRAKTELNRKILDHLLHQTFEGEAGEPESDLILDPNPDPATIQAVLGKYPFRDVMGAYHCLTQLATEAVQFLSTRRCRHFLASIAPQLLGAIAETPDPDMALVNLEKVTASLGGKAILWELFSFNPPSLKLYVELCASSEFLSEILITNPGMIDELLDSLVLNQPRSLAELTAELADLCRNAEDPDPILHSFHDKEILRIGVRDILGKDNIQATTAALSDVAEAILSRLADLQWGPMIKRFGNPQLAESPRAGQPARHVLLGLGKLGGREMSYQSDLDLILVYEGDGRTAPLPGSTRFDEFDLTDNFHYFTEFTQRIIKSASLLGPHGRLYHVDMRLRPTGKSGSLVIPLNEFRRYYESGGAQLWERQALTRARVVHGDETFGHEVMAAVENAVHGVAWKPDLVDEIVSMRERVEASGSERDLKRGFGGMSDVEFLVQMFRIKYGKTIPTLRTGNTWEALDALGKAGLLTAEEQTTLRTCYDFLREVEACLRIVHNRSLDELPDRPEEVERLARRMGSSGGVFRTELEGHLEETRELFLRVVRREREANANIVQIAEINQAQQPL
jgi:glutamate-ammonia-ligase adenylyltransferase